MSGFLVTEVLENGEEACIKNKVKLFTSQFLATYDSGLGEIYAQLGIFLVNVMRLLLLRFLQPCMTATTDKLFGKKARRIMF